MLRGLCAAVRAGEWAEVNATLASSTHSVSEWRAMVCAASDVKNWRGALSLLQRMESSGLDPDPAVYGHAIAACTRAAQTEPAMALLDRLDAAAKVPEARSFNMVISGFAKSDWKRALQLLRAMPGRGVLPTTVSYNAALSGCSRAKRWRLALQLLAEMEAQRGDAKGAPADVISYSSAAAACQRGGAWEEALRLLKRLERAQGQGAKEEGNKPAANVFTYTAAVTALSDAGKWQQALQTFDERPEAVRLNEPLVHAAICAAAAGQQWQRALSLLSELKEQRLVPRSASYNVAIGDWIRAIGVLGSMEETDDVEPNEFAWSAAIAAMERAGEWEKALALFEGIRNAGGLPGNGQASPALFNAAISAAGRGGDTAVAARLLQEMSEAKLTTGLRAFNGVLKACERNADGAEAERLLAMMAERGVRPDAISYTSAMGALGRSGSWERALALWQSMAAEGLEADSKALLSAMRALLGAGEWRAALETFEGAPSQARASSAVYAAAIAACAQGGEPRRATALLASMAAAEPPILPNLACYRGAVEACDKAGEWEAAMSVWQGMVRTEMEADTATYAALLHAFVSARRPDEARQLLDFAAREGVPLLAALEGDEGGGARLLAQLDRLMAAQGVGEGTGDLTWEEVSEAETSG